MENNTLNTIELKKSFHHLIDTIDNEYVLMNFYDIMKSRTSTKKGHLWNRLSLEEQEGLLSAIEESATPNNLINHIEMKKKHTKWF